MLPRVLIVLALLATRSNKVMYELNSKSMFDTFLGTALTGPLRAAGVVLTPVTVVTTTWGDWKTAHPGTTIVAQDGGRGIDYPADPLRGRDDNGPIFPVGDVDQRLDVQTLVLGLVNPDGLPIAFPVDVARDTLADGETIALAGVELLLDGGGLTAITEDGSPIATQQSFWFAWSRFLPDTLVWQP